MQTRSLIANLVAIFGLMTMAPWASPQCFAASQSGDVPRWLKEHVGEGDDQIAEVVLQRARELYLRKVSEGLVNNPCYFAMDATRPNDLGDGKVGRRFYVVCEAEREFRAVSPGHGGGRDLENQQRTSGQIGPAWPIPPPNSRGGSPWTACFWPTLPCPGPAGHAIVV